ncbi:MAG: hypothetical protein MRY21_04740 [Simkaniaceae bacterium]|nr:hypothetical protein [Simkaniaceae bacterium]
MADVNLLCCRGNFPEHIHDVLSCGHEFAPGKVNDLLRRRAPCPTCNQPINARGINARVVAARSVALPTPAPTPTAPPAPAAPTPEIPRAPDPVVREAMLPPRVVERAEDGRVKCPILLTGTDHPAVTECGHVIDLATLNTWLNQNNKCPCCNFSPAGRRVQLTDMTGRVDEIDNFVTATRLQHREGDAARTGRPAPRARVVRRGSPTSQAPNRAREILLIVGMALLSLGLLLLLVFGCPSTRNIFSLGARPRRRLVY